MMPRRLACNGEKNQDMQRDARNSETPVTLTATATVPGLWARGLMDVGWGLLVGLRPLLGLWGALGASLGTIGASLGLLEAEC